MLLKTYLRNIKLFFQSFIGKMLKGKHVNVKESEIPKEHIWCGCLECGECVCEKCKQHAKDSNK